MSERDEQALVMRAARGDREAFGDLATAHRDTLYSFAYRMLGDREQACDAAQEILIRAYTRLETFDRSRPFRPWLFTIAANTCTDMLRRRGRRGATVDDEGIMETLADDGPSPSRAAVESDLQDHVAGALGKLNETERTVVALKHIQGFTYEEISEMTDMPVGTLKSHAHRGRRKLAVLLEPVGMEGGG